MQIIETGRVYVKYKKNKRLLNERERFVLSAFYGFDKHFRHTLNEIGMLIGGVTRERARQIKEVALRKIGA